MGVMDIRRRILEEQPQLTTATGTTVNYTTNINAPLSECTINFAQVQTGTPSPTNIIPLTEWKNFSLFHSGDDTSNATEYSFSFSGTRYKGSFDLISGKVTDTAWHVELNGNSGWNNVGNKFYCAIGYTDFQNSTSTEEQFCNMYPFARISSDGSVGVTEDKHFYLQRTTTNLGWCRIWVYDSGLTLEQFKEMLNTTPLQATFPIVPNSYFVDSLKRNIKARIGQNKIWNSNGSTNQVKYWKA